MLDLLYLALGLGGFAAFALAVRALARGDPVTDVLLGGGTAVLILAYLVAVLARPDRF